MEQEMQFEEQQQSLNTFHQPSTSTAINQFPVAEQIPASAIFIPPQGVFGAAPVPKPKPSVITLEDFEFIKMLGKGVGL